MTPFWVTLPQVGGSTGSTVNPLRSFCFTYAVEGRAVHENGTDSIRVREFAEQIVERSILGIDDDDILDVIPQLRGGIDARTDAGIGDALVHAAIATAAAAIAVECVGRGILTGSVSSCSSMTR